MPKTRHCCVSLLLLFCVLYCRAQGDSTATIVRGIEVSYVGLNGKVGVQNFSEFLENARSAKSIIVPYDSISHDQEGDIRSASLDIKFDISYLLWDDSTMQRKNLLVGIGTGRHAARLYDLTVSGDSISDSLVSVGYYAQQFRVTAVYRIILNPKRKFKFVFSPGVRFGIDVSGELRAIGNDSTQSISMNPGGASYLSFKGYHLMADVPFGFQWQMGENMHLLFQYGVGLGYRRYEKKNQSLLTGDFHFGLKVDL